MQPRLQHTRPLTQSEIVGAVLIYGVMAALWILVSDSVVEWLFSDPAKISMASTVKGWGFVVVTSILLYGLLQRLSRRGAGEPRMDAMRPQITWTVIAVAVTIVAVATIAVVHTVTQQQDKEVLRLEAIADMKAGQVANWVADRKNGAGFLRSSHFLGEVYQHWRATGDERSRDTLFSRLHQFAKSSGFQGIGLLDDRGEQTLWDSRDSEAHADGLLREAAARARAEDRVVTVGPYRDARGKTRLDIVVMLPAAAGRPSPFAILQADPEATLYPMLRRWPGVKTTGEIVLVRPDGDNVLYLSELRNSSDAAVKLRIPLSAQRSLAAQVIRGEVGVGTVVKGLDYADVPALGVVRNVPGTDWLLVAKMDMSELYANSARDAVWIALAGLLALVMAVAVGLQFRQYRQLQASRQRLEGQAERLRAFDLLNAIAEGSTDAIFAKDSEGRYLLFNREAARVTGRRPEDVLGHDDTALFPPDQAATVMGNDQKVMAEDRTVALAEVLDTVDGRVIYSSIKGPLHDVNGNVVGMFGVSRDVTERRREEKALLEEAVRRRILFDQASDGIVIVNQDGGVDEANAAFAGMLGYASTELGSLHVWDWDVNWSDERLRADFATPVELSHSATFETRWCRRDGSILPVEITANPVELDDRVVAYCVCRDISRRLKAEEALNESQVNLIQSQRIAGIGHYVMDVATGRWTGSQILDELFGIDGSYPHDTGGWLNLIVAEERDSMAAYLRHQVLDHRHLFDREYRIARADNGEIRWMHGLGRLDLGPEGNPTRMVGTIQDVTERRRAEEQLRKLSLAVEQSPESIVITDLDARIEYVNDAFLRVTGYQREDVIGQNPRSAALGQDAERNLRVALGCAQERSKLEGRIPEQAQGRQRVRRVRHRHAHPAGGRPYHALRGGQGGHHREEAHRRGTRPPSPSSRGDGAVAHRGTG